MRALVVYESMFGNTKTIARAIAEGLSGHMEVEAIEVSTAPVRIPDDVGLLVVGGPTHGFGMSRIGTRQQAVTERPEPLVSRGIGLREWLDSRPSGTCGAAAFDTCFKKARMFGTAGRAAEKRLRKLGFDMVARAESFYVGGTTGPLRQGEIDRARRWGSAVGACATNAVLV